MNYKFLKLLYKKMEKYDKKASNPFINNEYKYNPFKSIYEQTYIWVEKTNNKTQGAK